MFFKSTACKLAAHLPLDSLTGWLAEGFELMKWEGGVQWGDFSLWGRASAPLSQPVFLPVFLLPARPL